MGKKSTKPVPKKVSAAPAKPTKQPKVISKAPRKALKKAVAAKAAKKPTPSQPKAKKVPKQSKKKAYSGPKGYTADQYETFKTLKNKFGGYSNQALKDLLRKNLQSMTGNKDDLVYKAADGAILGRIPRCPKCFGGRPKFDFQKGTYYCSGYRDDTDFHNCHSTFQLSEIKRDTWED